MTYVLFLQSNVKPKANQFKLKLKLMQYCTPVFILQMLSQIVFISFYRVDFKCTVLSVLLDLRPSYKKGRQCKVML